MRVEDEKIKLAKIKATELSNQNKDLIKRKRRMSMIYLTQAQIEEQKWLAQTSADDCVTELRVKFSQLKSILDKQAGDEQAKLGRVVSFAEALKFVGRTERT